MLKSFYRTALILSLTLSVNSLFAQERKVTVTSTVAGKQVVKEYSGLELEKLIQANRNKGNLHATSALQPSPHMGRNVVISKPGKKPEIFNESEIDKLIKKHSLVRTATAVPAQQSNSIMVIKQTDGSTKITKTGLDVNSK